jgi:hypothetical protein
VVLHALLVLLLRRPVVRPRLPDALRPLPVLLRHLARLRLPRVRPRRLVVRLRRLALPVWLLPLRRLLPERKYLFNI